MKILEYDELGNCVIFCLYYRVAVNPEEPPKIDWSYYKANAANKAIVEQFEKQYNNTKIPYPSDKGAYAKIEEEEKVQVSYYFLVFLYLAF